ncbi:hypothetical protein FVR03_01300 [Pontibacter qinzhouensis]|uniref:Uncharacterized protein n=1 Tax=Pontibacter qinzhouensis TaxID=2603253 RepID=A0A5C8KD90_9BACT|nr:HAD domain-containing protein [Pontibacter qinzhouensis]TXK52380.1 hypothetical protein FVR03_01300 [Pontibacter qinzhouensis]
MKVIFLDIDGVLNTTSHLELLRKKAIKCRDEFGHLFCPDAVENLEYLSHVSGAKVVISSTWRASGLKVIKDLFKYRMIEVDILSVTPFLNTPRGEEIAAWLSENDYVTNYVIIDDDADMTPEQAPFFVQTGVKKGLTRELANKALTILNS